MRSHDSWLLAGGGAQPVLLAVLWAGFGLGPAAWLAGTAYAVSLPTLLTLAQRRSGRRRLGPADRVTLARAVLVGGVTALVVEGCVHGAAEGAGLAILVVLASVALVLDGVDGQVARRTGTVSRLGARFDMEVDAFLILVLSVHVAFIAGPWVLAIGAMRYVFVVAAWALPWLRAELPPSLARKAVAALQGIALVVAGAGVLPVLAASALAGLALAALVWSFGRDVAWLWRASLAPEGEDGTRRTRLLAAVS
ncbi:CDP-alcohol phosphatidyltransferase family protein [Actinomadura rudentiformis]|uniref:CDP-alcohol phosphatidyltransferase family protein n=1 Tax=Actinomadura rudentiformis TaxID=359158 RepID=A0A6H9Z8B0_9ACTN|nr:CDP-alcohol phosphatidyltransferase family protein [Actinomadura rudentiformis]KAB2352576.1 CDP-alcohol phosphatidyltransferase family protein [Actinomadura rudentiformis]